MIQILYSLPPFLTASLLAALALLTLVRSPLHRVNRLFVALCLLGGLLNVDILYQLNASSAESALRVSRLLHLAHPFVLPVFVHFFHAYLKINSRRWLVVAVYVWAGVLAACSQGDLVVAAMQRFSHGFAGHGGPLYPMMAAGAVFVTFYNTALLMGAIRREKRSVQKNKLKYIFAGFVSLALLTCLNLLTRYGIALYPPGNFGFIPLAVFAAGLFRYDLLDMGQLLRKSLLYTVLTAMLTLVYASIVVLLQSAFAASDLAGAVWMPAILLAVIAFVFGPMKSEVQSLLDRLFRRSQLDYRRTILQASRTMASVLDYDKIKALLEETIIGGMQVSHCALFIRNSHHHRYDLFASVGHGSTLKKGHPVAADDDLIQCLMATRAPLVRHQWLARQPGRGARAMLAVMAALDAEVVLPLIFKDRLNGWIVLGEKRSGHIYSREDLDLLVILGHQSAVALENGSAYAALHALNRDLEAKVAERTRHLQQALAEKERTQEQLVRAESLASIGQLVAGVAHELNNPLASVTSLLQSTLEDLESWQAGDFPDAEMIDDLHFADRELARAKSIVASLLGLARQTQTYEERVDLSVVVQDALRVLHNQHKGERLRIDTRFDPDLPPVLGNYANLGQVAINILKNAIQAADPMDGRIDLRTRFERQGGEVVFECRDNGAGIDSAIRKDIFKPFFTTKPVGRGTGLGLYLCHGIVTRHGGSIDLQPAGNVGTLATVRLPAVESEGGAAGPDGTA